MSSDTILASNLRKGDLIKRQGQPDGEVIEFTPTDTRFRVKVVQIWHYWPNAPVVIARRAAPKGEAST